MPAPLPLPTGVGDLPAPFSSEEYSLSSSWWNTYGGKYYFVWAGASAEESSSGLIIIRVVPAADPDGRQSITSTDVYVAPEEHGKLTIRSANGFVLKVEAADGTTLSFDVLTGRFS